MQGISFGEFDYTMIHHYLGQWMHWIYLITLCTPYVEACVELFDMLWYEVHELYIVWVLDTRPILMYTW